MKTVLRALALCAAVLASGAALAADWTVQRITQTAQTSPDGKTWRPLERGADIADNAWVYTGRSGKLVLRRGRDTMWVDGGTLVRIDDSGTQSRPRTAIEHRFGEITVDVRKRGYDQMSVKTPFMAAVIKGTKFTVKGDKSGSQLRVARGLVEVANVISGQKALVGAGGKAEIGAGASAVEISGSNTSLVGGSATPGNGKAVGITEGKGNAYGQTGDKTNNAGGNGKSNAGGNGNSNAVGNGNSGNSNAGGNGGGNSNAGGNGNSGNSNAGGNGNGGGNGGGNSGNSNAGGNGNGNSGNSNAGGNGNGNGQNK